MKQNSLTSSEYHDRTLKITNKLTFFLARSSNNTMNVVGGQCAVIRIKKIKQSNLSQLIFCGSILYDGNYSLLFPEKGFRKV